MTVAFYARSSAMDPHSVLWIILDLVRCRSNEAVTTMDVHFISSVGRDHVVPKSWLSESNRQSIGHVTRGAVLPRGGDCIACVPLDESWCLV